MMSYAFDEYNSQSERKVEVFVDSVVTLLSSLPIISPYTEYGVLAHQ